MLNDYDLVAFVATTDIVRARDFYAQTLGLVLVEDTPWACVFDAHGTKVRVTPVESKASAPYTVLGWEVPDITIAVRDLTERGVEMMEVDGIEQDDRGVWTTPGGDQIAWFKDLDDNTLSLSQHAA
jgi:catechol 2,3-dioxygenase-like lactoylglutathione lyase family enzyme